MSSDKFTVSSWANWQAFHLHYHADLDLLLQQLIRPLVCSMLDEKSIDRFYFVRYGLGGPHVRLRLRWAAEPTPEKVQRASLRFFDHSPSLVSLSERAILQNNQRYIQSDPVAEESQFLTVPDNSLVEAKPIFEIDRYGGTDRFSEALDFFAVSSSCTLLILDSSDFKLSKGLRLNRAFAVIGLMSWNLAESLDDFLRLTTYAEYLMGTGFSRCLEEADQLFERRIESLTLLLKRVLGAEPLDEPSGILSQASSRLALSLTGLADSDRWRTAASHIHMSVNRLGLSNPDEVYASRLLWRAALELRQKHSDFLQAAWSSRSRQTSGVKKIIDLLGLASERLKP